MRKQILAGAGAIVLLAATALGATAAAADEAPPEEVVEALVVETVTPPAEVVEHQEQIEPTMLETAQLLVAVDVDYVTVAWNATEGDIWNPAQTVVGSVETDEPDLSAMDEALAALGQNLECGTTDYFQVDVYFDNATTDALLAGGVLYGPSNPDEDLIPGGEGTAWKYVKVVGPECPPPPTMQECVDYSQIHNPSLAFGESSNDGSAYNRLGVDNLHVATFDNDPNAAGDQGHRKAAGYIAVNFPLAELGDFELTSTGTGSTPGGQVRVDITGDGVWDFTLVDEPLYGGSIWASIPGGQTWVPQSWAPHSPGGGGYPNQGTYNEWLAALHDAGKTPVVTQVGYSLGSGVTGDHRITKLTAGCVEYTFGAPAPLTEERQSSVEGDPDCEAGTVTTTTTFEAREQGAWDEETQSRPWGEWYVTGTEETSREATLEECPPPPTDPPTETPDPEFPEALPLTGNDSQPLVLAAVGGGILVGGAMIVLLVMLVQRRRRSAE